MHCRARRHWHEERTSGQETAEFEQIHSTATSQHTNGTQPFLRGRYASIQAGNRRCMLLTASHSPTRRDFHRTMGPA